MVDTIHEDLGIFTDNLVSNVTRLTCLLNEARLQHMKYRWNVSDG